MIFALALTLAAIPRPAHAALLQGVQQLSCPAANGTPEDPSYPVRKAAFAALTANNAAEAQRLFRCAATENANDRVALAQLAYLDIRAGDKPAAIQDIERLRALNAITPELELQIGYLYYAQRRLEPARLAFERALKYDDPAIKTKAQSALAVIEAEAPRRWTSLYLDTQYMERFHDQILDGDARAYQRLGPEWPVSFYAHARLLRDTASHAGALPQIFSDNAALFGGGLFLQSLRAHWYVNAEGNEAYLFKENTRGKTDWVPDWRAWGGYFRSWPEKPKRLGFEANGSIGFYSRYQHDTISYLQPREVAGLFHLGSFAFTGFVQENFSLDTNRLFYNNVAEVTPGLEIRSLRLPVASLRAEYVRGWYLPVPADAQNLNPYGTEYHDIRIRLLLWKSSSLDRRAGNEGPEQ